MPSNLSSVGVWPVSMAMVSMPAARLPVQIAVKAGMSAPDRAQAMLPRPHGRDRGRASRRVHGGDAIGMEFAAVEFLQRERDAQLLRLRLHRFEIGLRLRRRPIGIAHHRAAMRCRVLLPYRARFCETTRSVASPSTDSPKSGPWLMRPRVGFKPTRPLHEAGMRIEPPPSLACAIGKMPAATAAAEPPDEPPVECSRFQGLCAAP